VVSLLAREIFSSPNRPDRLWGISQSPIQWVPTSFPPGVKQPEHTLKIKIKIKIKIDL
jgi:hypothetical protein